MTFDQSTRSRTSTVTRTRYTTEHTQAGVAVARGAAAWAVVHSGTTAAVAWCRRTITPTGWLAAILVAVVLPLGAWWGWAEWVSAGLVAGILIVGAVLFVLGRRSYEVDLGLLRERVVAGDEAFGGVTVRNVGQRTALPSRVEIPMGDSVGLVDVPLLRAGQEHSERVPLPTAQRAVVPVGPVRAVRSDPLGLVRLEKTWHRRYALYVHPRTVPIPSTSAGLIRDLEGNPTRTIADADISFHALREYAPGDSLRHIHWKATAKTGVPMVRQFEETRRSRMALVLSCRAAEYADAEEYELAVSLAGSLGTRALQDGRNLDLVVPQDVPEAARRLLRGVRRLPTVTVRTMLDGLSAVAASENAGRLAESCELTAQSTPGLSIAFLLCGSTVSLRELRTASLKFPENVTVVAVVADPQSVPQVRVAAGMAVITVPLLTDLRHLLLRGGRS